MNRRFIDIVDKDHAMPIADGDSRHLVRQIAADLNRLVDHSTAFACHRNRVTPKIGNPHFNGDGIDSIRPLLDSNFFEARRRIDHHFFGGTPSIE